MQVIARHGTFRRDLNEEILQDFLRTITKPWNDHFENQAKWFIGMDRFCQTAVDSVLKDVQDSLPPALLQRASNIMKKSKLEISPLVDRLLMDCDESTLSVKLDITDTLTSFVKDELLGAYEKANTFHGKGSILERRVGSNNLEYLFLSIDEPLYR